MSSRGTRRLLALLRRSNPILVRERLDQSTAIPGFSPAYLSRRTIPPPVLRFPPTVPATTLRLPADELTLGVEMGGEARAYPIASFWRHHIVNETLGGAPLLVSFCRKCFGAVAFDPRVDGRTLTFDLFGAYEGGTVLIDDQTGTLWASLSGTALVGRLAGRRLQLLPLRLASLGSWLALHPESSTPDPDAMVRPERWLPGAYRFGRAWRRTVSRWDGRLPARTFVLGVEAGGATRAYPLSLGDPGPLVCQDEVGGIPIALLADAGTWPLAFDRRSGGEVVELRADGGRVVDATGSTWTGDGRAVDGPNVGQVLEYVPSRGVEWYAWAALHPQTSVGTLRPTSPG